MNLIPADVYREADAKRIFSEYTNMSPEEWDARFGHTIALSSFVDYVYQDQALHTWIHRLHEILRTPGAIAQYRLHLLSPEERLRIEDEETEF